MANVNLFLLCFALSCNSLFPFSNGARQLTALVEEQPLAMTYHKGALLTGPISVNLIWYGKFTAPQRAIVTDFAASLSSPSKKKGGDQKQRPSVSSWWRTVEKYYAESKTGMPRLALGDQILDESYPLGKSLTGAQIAKLAAKGAQILLKFLSLPLLFLFIFTLSNFPLKTPFRPSDLLPLLPREVSWPILRSLNSAVDLLPTFVGAASSPNSTLEWKGACFYKNQAWMEFHNKSGSQFGGGTLHIKTSKAHSWTCMDLYVFATPYRVTWDYYFLGREHTLEIKEWEGKQEYEYVKNNGLSIFLMQSGMIGTLRALWDVFPLFTNTGWGENSNLAFLKKHMGASFEERPKPWFTNITVDDIHSGDFLAISKIRGRWGGFETLEKWVTGAFAGHTAVCLKDSEGKLWVGESGHENEEGEDIIAVLPWDEWWEFELNKDDSNPQIALLPLHPDIRAKFNSTAAWEYARSMSGKPYGYHNMIFSWIDTISGNYPPPLDAHLVASVMTMWSKMQPAYAANMWNEALNKRLDTKGLDLPEIIVESERRGISFEKLLTIPERDDWIYTDGKSTSCVAFILEMYKHAGLFDPIANSIQVTEFTIKDAYALKFFEDDPSRLPEWCNKDDDVKLPFCQIKGKYRMELPEYNSMIPYPHMNEHCPSLPPNYIRSRNC